MIARPIVSLTFGEGSGGTTANHGSAGGNFTVNGGWTSTGGASTNAGAYLTPGTAAYASGSVNFSYVNDGNWTIATLVRASAISPGTLNAFSYHGGVTAPGQKVELSPSLQMPSSGTFTQVLQLTAVTDTGAVRTTTGSSSLGTGLPTDTWVLVSLVANNYSYTPYVVNAGTVFTGLSFPVQNQGAQGAPGTPVAPSFSGNLPFYLGGLQPNGQGDMQSAFKGGLDSYSVHDAVLSSTQLQELYWAGLRGLTLGQANTSVNIAAASSMTGGAGADALDALNTAAALSGLAGDDVLLGSEQGDTLLGGAGQDTLQGRGGDDTLDGGGDNDSLDGGAGNDTASYAAASAAVQVSLAVSGAQNTGGAGTDTLTSIERLLGSAFHDTLTGGTGDDTLDGGAGNDSIDGGLGVGIDTASYASATAGVLVGLAVSGAQNTGAAGTDTLTRIENLLGSAFNDTLGGNAFTNRLSGGDGDDQLFAVGQQDTLDGGAGNDTLYGTENTQMFGGTGDDVYQLTNFLQAISEDAGGGFDRAFITSNNYILGANLEVGYLSGSATTLQGGDADEVLVANPTLGSRLSGSGGDDTLWGGAGNDTLRGGNGNDVLRAGSGGSDDMDGGAGDDVFVVLNAGDSAEGGSGFNTVFQGTASWSVDVDIQVVRLFGAGVSTNVVGFGVTLVANDALGSTLQGAMGNDTLWGQDHADMLIGGRGGDVLRGGAGNDTLVGGSQDDQLVGGTGADRFAFNAPSWGFDTVHDFNRGQGDRIDMTGSGVSGFGALAVQVIGPNTMLLFGTERIDVYGVTDLGAGDFIFG